VAVDWLQNQGRIVGGEDEQTEFKEWDANLEKIARALCAMSNGLGGLVIVGRGCR
jgi:predicted HTH transcriptional regulator